MVGIIRDRTRPARSLRKVPGNYAQLCRCPFYRPTGFQPAITVSHQPSRRFRTLNSLRSSAPHRAAPPHRSSSDLDTQKNSGRRYPDHLERMLLNRDLAPDDGFVTTVLTLPEGMADDYSGRRALGPVVRKRKQSPPFPARCPARRRIRRAHPKALHGVDWAARRDIKSCRSPGEHPRERLLLRTDLLPHGFVSCG